MSATPETAQEQHAASEQVDRDAGSLQALLEASASPASIVLGAMRYMQSLMLWTTLTVPDLLRRVREEHEHQMQLPS